MEDKTNEMNEGLSLIDILEIIKKHLLVIILTVIVCTVAGFTFSKIQDSRSPKYQVSSSMMMSVNDTKNSSMMQEYQLSDYLKETYVAFVTEDVVLDEVVNSLKNTYSDLTAKSIKEKLTVSTKGKSLIMQLTYTDISANKAADVLNAIMNKVVDEANSMDGDKPVYKMLNDNVVIVNNANPLKATQNTRTMKYTLIFFAGGLVLAFLYVLARELFDTNFKDDKEVEKILNIPVLAVVPEYNYLTNMEEAK